MFSLKNHPSLYVLQSFLPPAYPLKCSWSTGDMADGVLVGPSCTRVATRSHRPCADTTTSGETVIFNVLGGACARTGGGG